MKNSQIFSGEVVAICVRQLLACVLCLFFSAGAWANTFRIGVLTFEPADQTLAKWQATAEHLSAQIPPHRFEVVPLNYEEINSAVNLHEVDFVFTNPEHYVVLRNVYGISPLATLNIVVGSKTVTKFGSVIFTTSNNDKIQQLSDVKGHRVAAVGLYSLGGFLAAADTFRQHQVNLQSDDVKSLEFVGTPHKRVVDAVLSGHADVGIVRTGVLEQLAVQGKIDFSQVKVLNLQPDSVYPQALSTALYPEWPMAAMPQVPPELSKSVTLALLQIGSVSQAAIKGKYTGFYPPANYAEVESLMRRLNVYPNVEIHPIWKDVWLQYTREIQVSGLMLLIAGLISSAYLWRGNRHLRRLTVLYKDSQDLLEKERTQLQYIIEGTNAGTWQLNMQTGDLIVNARWVELAGYTLQDRPVWGLRDWMDLCHPHDLRRVIRAFRAHCTGKTAQFQCEYRVRHGSGHWIWVQDSGRLLKAETDASTAWAFGTHTDVTARVQAQQAHEEQLAFIQVLLESLPTAVYIKDTLGRYQRFNKAFEELFGIERSDWLGKTVFELVPGEIAHFMHQKDQELFKTGEPQIYEATFTNRAMGQSREGLYYKSLITGRAGDVVGMVGTVVDVTERNQSARALQESNRQAQAATLAKGFFLANMSHELRTPMHAILGMLKLLHTTEQTERQHDYSSKAENAAKGLLVLLDDILDFSKMDAGKMELDPQPFLLDGLLRNLATVLSATRRRNDVEVLFDVDPSLPRSVLGDSMRLQQILINLGSNAIKFTEYGRVVIGISRMQPIWSDSTSATLLFSVSDTGIGIAEENFDRIFSGFSQAEASTTRKFGGTGLGLAISKRLIELMGGQIRLTSELDVGSTFSFELQFPLASMPERRAVPRCAPLAPQHVLIVDDSKLSVALMSKLTQSLGWTCDTAFGGLQALDILQGKILKSAAPYDVVFLDWKMPEMDGWETLQRIQSLFTHYKSIAPKIIMVSSNGRENLAQRTQAEQDALSGFLVKPATASMLHEAVQRKLGSDPQIRSRARASKRQLAGLKILVVEDNLLNQQVAEELLVSEGAVVDLAENGRVAVNALAEPDSRYDAVLMDIQMPVLDGFAATREIRQGLQMKDIPIIGLTANAMPIDRDNCLAAGMNEHMGKPFDLRELVSLLIRLTGHIPAEPADQQRNDQTLAVNVGKLVNAHIDVESALARMGGLHSVYTRSARTLHDSLGGFIDQLRNSIESGDLHKTQMLVHTYKGTSATLGLVQLSSELAHLENKLKSHAQIFEVTTAIDSLHSTLSRARTELLGAIDSLTVKVVSDSQPQADSNSIAHDSEKLKAGLTALAVLLDKSDMNALDQYSELTKLIKPSLLSIIEPLELAIQNLDFEAAKNECSRLINEGRFL